MGLSTYQGHHEFHFDESGDVYQFLLLQKLMLNMNVSNYSRDMDIEIRLFVHLMKMVSIIRYECVGEGPGRWSVVDDHDRIERIEEFCYAVSCVHFQQEFRVYVFESHFSHS